MDINGNIFNDIISYDNNINIQSYNKIYNVQFVNSNLNDIINKYYILNDFIIIDKNVYNLNNNCFENIDKKYYYIFDALEQNKTMDYVLIICDILNDLKFTKNNKILVIGGGITQDVCGFVCAIYKRGLQWIFIPTTLLSMTDSAIGGKVCINRNSKNILSLFMAPNNVIISDKFLLTLTQYDIISGLGESLKLSLIYGKDSFFKFKENYINKNYIDIIKLSIEIKKIIIEYDELEKNERKVLNYGHTFGHALECTTEYFIPHGIAVLFGMYIINLLFYDDKFIEINKYILNMIPDKFKNIHLSFDKFVNHLLNDKKNIGNKICFILLDDIGKTLFIYKNIEEINIKLKQIFEKLFKCI